MNLTTTYLGLELRSPLVVGAAAPLSEDLDNIKRLEDAGADALELNIDAIPTDMDLSGDDLETQYLNIVSTVKSAIEIGKNEVIPICWMRATDAVKEAIVKG